MPRRYRPAPHLLLSHRNAYFTPLSIWAVPRVPLSAVIWDTLSQTADFLIFTVPTSVDRLDPLFRQLPEILKHIVPYLRGVSLPADRDDQISNCQIRLCSMEKGTFAKFMITTLFKD